MTYAASLTDHITSKGYVPRPFGQASFYDKCRVAAKVGLSVACFAAKKEITKECKQWKEQFPMALGAGTGIVAMAVMTAAASRAHETAGAFEHTMFAMTTLTMSSFVGLGMIGMLTSGKITKVRKVGILSATGAGMVAMGAGAGFVGAAGAAAVAGAAGIAGYAMVAGCIAGMKAGWKQCHKKAY
jgi:hypothetical protein